MNLTFECQVTLPWLEVDCIIIGNDIIQQDNSLATLMGALEHTVALKFKVYRISTPYIMLLIEVHN